jgi:hypothetical protein
MPFPRQPKRARKRMSGKVPRAIEKLKLKLRKLPLKEIRANFYFHGATDEQFREFCEAFAIKADFPDYVKKYKNMYEVGESKFEGMNITVFGPDKSNPRYLEEVLTEEQKELAKLGHMLSNVYPQIAFRALEMLATTDIVTIDNERARDFFEQKGFHYPTWIGDVKRYFELKKKEAEKT